MLTRWFDIPTIPSLARELSLWDSLFDQSPAFVRGRKTPAYSVTAPRFTAEEKDGDYIIRADLPGMTEEDINVTVHEGVLIVRGEQKTELPDGYHVHLRERAGLRFARSLQLAKDVDVESIQARMENGVLTLRVPRLPAAQPRQIPIKIG